MVLLVSSFEAGLNPKIHLSVVVYIASRLNPGVVQVGLHSNPGYSTTILLHMHSMLLPATASSDLPLASFAYSREDAQSVGMYRPAEQNHRLIVWGCFYGPRFCVCIHKLPSSHFRYGKAVRRTKRMYIQPACSGIPRLCVSASM